MMWWSDGTWSWWMAIPMTLGMIAFWGLVIWAVVTVVRPDALWRGGSPTITDGPAATPEERLAVRLAEGEIDPPEYEERLKALRG
jgi:putative membrane protein